MEPLTIAVLAGLTPDCEISFYDDRIEAIPYDLQADLVAISVKTYTARRAYDLAARFRERGMPVVLGGYHPSLIPGEACEYADSIVIGEAECVWHEVVADAASGRLKKIYSSSGRPNLSGIRPDRSLYRNKKYMPLTLVETSRGCRFSCNFCSISAFYRRTYNYRPPREVADEIAGLGSKRIFFVDDNIGAYPEYTRRLCGELARLNLRWVSQCSVNALRDITLIRDMAKSGCVGLLIGFESLDPENLGDMDKSWNSTMKGYEDVLAVVRDHGIAVYATFIIGYDHDNSDTFQKTVEFALRQKFFITAFNHLVPFPGTELYRRLHREGRLLFDKWWLHPGYRYGDIAFRPKLLTPEELAEGCMTARRSFFSYSSIFSRGLDFAANCRSPLSGSLYFSTNLKLRNEVLDKKGILLGQGLDS